MSSNLDRRRFLQVGALAGAASLIPSLQAKGTDLANKANSEIGKSKWDLDSPALCLDLDKMEKNIKAAHEGLKGTGVGVRPHFKTHKCPALAKLQMKAGAVGVCAAKLSEAEVIFDNGIDKILMTGVNVTVSKIQRAMALRKKTSGFIQSVDNPQNAQDLNNAAKAAGVIADVVVDLDVIKRSGVLNGAPALALAQLIDKLPNLRFKGVLAYDGYGQHVKGYEARKANAIKVFEPILESYDLMKKAGLNMEIFSAGGTGTYNIMPFVPHITDVQVGSYLFMDRQYMNIGGKNNETLYDDFAPSLTVLTTIINTNFTGRLTTDAGSKAFTLNKPNPLVIGEPDFDYAAGSDEYGMISYTSSNKTYKVGDKLEAIIPHCDPAVNEYDFMYGIRNDKVESILPILARGKSV
jgi:D-serine deaminase-like pyridoxal phosphate-dependent protein